MNHKDWLITEGRCFKCARLIRTQDDEAYVCTECGGRNRLLHFRKPALWRRLVRAVTDTIRS